MLARIEGPFPPELSDSQVQPAVSPDPASTFDYTGVAADLAQDMRAAAARVQHWHRAAVIEVGRELSAIKDRIEHGQFVKWVTRECQMSIRGAQRAMQAAEMIAINDKLSYLPVDGLLALGKRDAPEQTVANLFERIDAGEKPSGKQIKKEIKEAQREAAEAALEASLTPRQRKSRAERKAEQERWREELERERACREAAATRAANILRECLGNRLAEFLAEAKDALGGDILQQLRERGRARSTGPQEAQT